MNYYIEDNNEIKIWASTKKQLQDTITLMPQYSELEIKQTQKEIIEYNGQYVFKADVIDELFEDKKAEKKQENQDKLNIARNGHVFNVELQGHECTFDTSDKTQNDLNSATLAANAGYPWSWTTNNKVVISLQVEDIITVMGVYQTLVNADINTWTNYENQIDNARTIADLDNIIINY